MKYMIYCFIWLFVIKIKFKIMAWKRSKILINQFLDFHRTLNFFHIVKFKKTTRQFGYINGFLVKII